MNQYEAVRLFIDRARSVKSDFEVNNNNAHSIAQLCSQLDGIPLAIELAAARINVLNVEKILDNINNRFKILTGGSRTAQPRQKTLRAMIDWSYDLLSEKEKLMLERLSVFSGGWSMEAAEEICSDDGIKEFEVLDLITNLVNKSIVISKEINGITRYSMLETIKQYSLEKLNSKKNIYEKHFDYFLKLSSKLRAQRILH
ncbi:MAG: hypothetical protein M3R36_15790 [Bacteroidota bacterium]|nr:hypothetical protein [Bacteroidota bacterium]